jgi:hypothetical protein
MLKFSDQNSQEVSIWYRIGLSLFLLVSLLLIATVQNWHKYLKNSF